MLSFFTPSLAGSAFHERKQRKSSNPVAAFFQKPSREQKKAWKEIVQNANKMQKDVVERARREKEINKQ